MHFPEHPEINEIFLFSKTSALDLLSLNQPESWPDFEHNWICIHEIFFGFIFQSVWVMPVNLPIECHKHSIIVIDVKNPKMAVFESSPRRRLKLLKNCIFGLLRPKFLFFQQMLVDSYVSYCAIFPKDLLRTKPPVPLSPVLLTFSTILVILPSDFSIALITIDCKWDFYLLPNIFRRFPTSGPVFS